MSRGPDAGVLLERRLVAHALAQGVSVQVDSADWTRWASATFVGARHMLTLQGDDDARLACWLAQLGEADLPLRGHLVADLKVVEVHRAGGVASVRIEALTLEER